jgi:hypothetical protein
LAPECICSFYLNVTFDIFWNVKKIQQQNRMYVFTCYVCTKSFHKKTTCRLAYVKRQILVLKTRHFIVLFILSFYTDHLTYCFFREILRTHMDYGNVHAKFFIPIF